MMRILFTIWATLGLAIAPQQLEAQDVQEGHASHANEQLANGHEAHPNAELPEKMARPEDSQAGPHGGILQQAGETQLEVLVEPGGLRLFAYDRAGQPLDISQSRGLATLQIEGNAKRYRYDLFPEVDQDQRAHSLAIAVDLSQIAGQKVAITFQLIGLLPGQRQPVQVSTSTLVPRTEAQQVAAAIARQKICPVSGQPLGSMGKPIPVAIGTHTVYVCCEGCIAKVKAEPQKYLAMVSGSGGAVPPGSEEVRPGVYKVTAADQPFIAAQQKCPVMDEPLDGMGGPFKVHANGKAVYICCPGCAKKIIAEPTTYLEALAAAGVSPPNLQAATDSSVAPAAGEEVRPGIFKATAADQPFVEAQKVCPVMDEPLDAMGGPYRTVVDGRAVYLCCPGCAKKLHQNPDVYLRKLAANGVTPPRAR